MHKDFARYEDQNNVALVWLEALSSHLGRRATGAPEGETTIPDGVNRDIILVGYARARHCNQVGHENDPQHRPKGEEGVDDVDDDDDVEDTFEEPGCLCYLSRV